MGFVSTLPYRIRRSDRALHARILVDADGVQVVVPRRFPLRNVEPFVQEKRPWIERTLRRMRESESEVPRPQIQQGGGIPYLGERLVLDMSAEAGRTRPFVCRRGEELRVVLPADADPRNALEAWYRRQARSEVAVRLDAAVARAGRSYTTLQIRGQRTRWASCSASGAMSFNWRLLLAPAPVLDYVVWHEVCHLREMNHSPRYWALVARHCPGYEEPRRWLRRNATALRVALRG